MELVCEGIAHRYGALNVLDGIDLVVREGECLALLGPSGCGKSTLLGIMGGVLGCASGCLVVQVVNWTFPTKVHLFASPSLLLFSLVFSTLLGMSGGLYPAFWAVRMSPMEAIRRG